MRAVRLVVAGVLGLVLTPVVMSFAIYSLLYAISPNCRSGPDSWGCSMTAWGIGMIFAIPGVIAGILLGLRWNRHARLA